MILAIAVFSSHFTQAHNGNGNGNGNKDSKKQEEPVHQPIPFEIISNQNGGKPIYSELESVDEEGDTSYTSFSKLNFIFYFIYKYKYENRSSLEDVKNLTID